MGVASTTPRQPPPALLPTPLVPLYVRGLIDICSKSNIEPASTKSYFNLNLSNLVDQTSHLKAVITPIKLGT